MAVFEDPARHAVGIEPRVAAGGGVLKPTLVKNRIPRSWRGINQAIPIYKGIIHGF